jgi:SulP family sulfate permease
VILAIALAALVFGGLLAGHLADGIGLYLLAGALTLAIFAWRGGARGVVGGLQDATAAVLAIVATNAALGTFGGPDRAFLTVIAATLVVTVLCGVVFLALGASRRGNLVRFVPYPVMGGFLAGTGWLLMKGGIVVASGVNPYLRFGDLLHEQELMRWVPAFVFGALLLAVSRLVRRPLVIPILLGAGLIAFVIGMLATGSSLAEAKEGRWLLGPFESGSLWQPWVTRALTGADWWAVLGQWAGIAAAVFIAVIGMWLNVSASEPIVDEDLDPNRELRDAGIANVVSGAVGGIPGYHSLGLTSLVRRMDAHARTAGSVAALVPLAALVAGARFVELIPRFVVGGVLVFLGLAFIVEWVWDKRRVLPRVEYVVLLVILAGIVAKGFLPGVVIGVVMSVVLFAVSYGKIELVREVTFGETYRSNVDRPAAERAALREMGERVQILRVNGFVFFGSANGLLERIRKRVEETAPPRFLLLELRRVTGVDASAVVSFVKVVRLAEANGFELVLTGASDAVRAQLERGGVQASEGIVRFEPDLDRGLQRCEDVLLDEARAERLVGADPDVVLAGLSPRLSSYLEREELAEGAVLIRQDTRPDDVFVLESGRLRVEMQTPEGRRMRLRTVLPGVVVGEVAMYTRAPRTADVVAEEPSVVLRLSQASIERVEAEEPELAAALHRWLAGTLAGRLTDTQRAVEALFD